MGTHEAAQPTQRFVRRREQRSGVKHDRYRTWCLQHLELPGASRRVQAPVRRRLASSFRTVSPASDSAKPRSTLARKYNRSMASSTVESGGNCSSCSNTLPFVLLADIAASDQMMTLGDHTPRREPHQELCGLTLTFTCGRRASG